MKQSTFDNLGTHLLDVIRRQRETFTRTTDGKKLITNPILYNLLEEESYFLQLKIGAENKRRIKIGEMI